MYPSAVVNLCTKTPIYTCTANVDCGQTADLQCDSAQGSCMMRNSTNSLYCDQHQCAFIHLDVVSFKTCTQTSECGESIFVICCAKLDLTIYSLLSSSEAYLLGHKLVCNKGHCVCLRLYDGQCHDKTISSECTTDEDCQLVHHSLSVCVKGFCACPAQHKLMNTHCVDVSTMKGNFTLHLQC